MKSVPACVSFLWILWAELLVMVLLWVLYDLDEEMQVRPKRCWLQTGGFLTVICTLGMCFVGEPGIWSIGSFLIGTYLALCTTMDVILKRVSDFFQYIGLLGALLMLLGGSPGITVLWELIAYVIIQYVFFSKMYGRADVVAFVICALVAAGQGLGIDCYIGHMAITFSLVFVVQFFKHNIALNGNLKQPIALFPYIISGFFMII